MHRGPLNTCMYANELEVLRQCRNFTLRNCIDPWPNTAMWNIPRYWRPARHLRARVWAANGWCFGCWSGYRQFSGFFFSISVRKAAQSHGLEVGHWRVHSNGDRGIDCRHVSLFWSDRFLSETVAIASLGRRDIPEAVVVIDARSRRLLFYFTNGVCKSKNETPLCA